MKGVTILGAPEPCGAYILRIHISNNIAVRFGCFRNGRATLVPKGEAVYVGSAMARVGSMTLARRALRHATRRPPRPPHGLRSELMEALVRSGMTPGGIQPPQNKQLRWNIDYLLDEETVHLTAVYLLRSSYRLEEDLADMLLTDPASHIFSAGLGAHDHRGSTHLLQICAGENWWRTLPKRLNDRLSLKIANPGRI